MMVVGLQAFLEVGGFQKRVAWWEVEEEELKGQEDGQVVWARWREDQGIHMDWGAEGTDEEGRRVKKVVGMMEEDGRRRDNLSREERMDIVEEILVGRKVQLQEVVDLADSSMELCMELEELKSEVPVVDEKVGSEEDDRLGSFHDGDHPLEDSNSQDRRPIWQTGLKCPSNSKIAVDM
jgi:hypothetical protein